MKRSVLKPIVLFWWIFLPCVSVKWRRANRYGLRWTSLVKWLLRTSSKWILWLARWQRFSVGSDVFAVSAGTVEVDELLPRVTTDQKPPVNQDKCNKSFQKKLQHRCDSFFYAEIKTYLLHSVPSYTVLHCHRCSLSPHSVLKPVDIPLA